MKTSERGMVKKQKDGTLEIDVSKTTATACWFVSKHHLEHQIEINTWRLKLIWDQKRGWHEDSTLVTKFIRPALPYAVAEAIIDGAMDNVSDLDAG